MPLGHCVGPVSLVELFMEDGVLQVVASDEGNILFGVLQVGLPMAGNVLLLVLPLGSCVGYASLAELFVNDGALQVTASDESFDLTLVAPFGRRVWSVPLVSLCPSSTTLRAALTSLLAVV